MGCRYQCPAPVLASAFDPDFTLPTRIDPGCHRAGAIRYMVRERVFSRTLDRASWANTTLLRGDPAAEVRRMKQENGPDLAILGSGSIVSQLTAARLIDQYQIVLCPVVLGRGRTLFETVTEKVPLALTSSRQFRNGNVVLTYSR